MSGRHFPNHVLGRGRRWDGIPLPDEMRAQFWPSYFDNEDAVPPTRFFDLYYDDGPRELYVITDQGSWHEISRTAAQKLVAWLASAGQRPKSLDRILRAKRVPDPLPERDCTPRDLSGNPVHPHVRRLTSPGREKHLWRRIDGGGRTRSRDRRQARTHKFIHHD